MNTRKLGTSYEKIAADYLTDKGYEILEMNFRNRMGEIDIIAENEHYLAFIFRFNIHPSFCFLILVMMLPVDQIDQAAQQDDRTDQMQPQH